MHLHGVADIFQVNQIHQLSPCIVMPWAERGNIRQCINDRMPEEDLMNTWVVIFAVMYATETDRTFHILATANSSRAGTSTSQ